MKDQIILADELGEPHELGWTLLGPVDRPDCWQNTGWIYCKEGKFALFNEFGPEMEFITFLEKPDAMRALFERYDSDLTVALVNAAYSNNQRVAKGLEQEDTRI